MMLTVNDQSIITPNLLLCPSLRFPPHSLAPLGPPPIVLLARKTGLPESFSSPLHQTVCFACMPLGQSSGRKKEGPGEVPCSFQLTGTPLPCLWARETDLSWGAPFLCGFCVGCRVWIWPTLGSKEKKNKQKTHSHCFCLSSSFDFLPQSPCYCFFSEFSCSCFSHFPRILVVVSGREQRTATRGLLHLG